MKEVNPAEILTDHDTKILKEVSLCMLNIWSREIEEKKRDRIYDNVALDAFMSTFVLMVDDLIRDKNVKKYVSHVYGGPRIAIDAPIKYEEVYSVNV